MSGLIRGLTLTHPWAYCIAHRFLPTITSKNGKIDNVQAPRGAGTPRGGTDTGGPHMNDVISPKPGDIRRARELGRKGHARYQWHSCESCGECRWVQYNQLLAGRHKQCKACANDARAKALAAKSGGLAPNWRGGRYVCAAGYIRVLIAKTDPFSAMAQPNGYVAEHRLVMARHLGRSLRRDEVVHHKNGDKQDNRLQNLELLSASAHALRHTSGYQAGFEKGYEAGESQYVAELKARIDELEKQLAACRGEL